MKKKLVDNILRILDIHYGFWMEEDKEDVKTAQRNYYEGLKSMAEIIISDYYMNGKGIDRKNGGKHYIVEGL